MEASRSRLQNRISDTQRPNLSLGWYDPDSDKSTRDRLAYRGDKIGLHGTLPPWFAGLLPEGALRELVLKWDPGTMINSTS